MTATELLRMQLSGAHEMVEQMMGGMNDEQVHHLPSGTALPVSALYAHMVVSEDMLVNGMLQQKTPLSMTDWTDKTALSEPMPGFDQQDWGEKHAAWAKRVQVDLPQAKEYAKAVYAATDAYLAGLADDEVDKDFDLSSFGMGMKPLAFVMSAFVVGHANNLIGEIAAVKGFQGLKGYPF